MPVVFVTASADDGTLDAAFRAGGRDYVRKPIRRVELLTRIERVLEQPRASRKLAEITCCRAADHAGQDLLDDINGSTEYEP